MKQCITYLIAFLISISLFLVSNIDSKAIGKPKVLYTNSKGYSTFAKWTEIKGADGYAVYYSKYKNGNFKLLKKVTNAQFTHKELDMNKTYYYKIRSFLSKKKIKYSTYSNKIEIKTKVVDKPKVYTWAHMYYGYDGLAATDQFNIAIANASKHNIKILTKGKMIDVVRSEYNRNLTLVTKYKGEYFYGDSFVIKPKYHAPKVYYLTNGKSTFYNRDYASIIVYYEYQGKTFRKEANSYDNDKYDEYMYSLKID